MQSRATVTGSVLNQLVRGFLLVALVAVPPSSSAEVCGLQSVVYDTIFKNGVDPPQPPVLGPALANASAPVLGLAPTVSITYPLSGTNITTRGTAVLGTYTGPKALGISVNDSPAYLVGSTFFIPNVGLDVGGNTLTAVATTLDGLTGTSLVSVSRSAGTPVVLISADQKNGPKPLQTAFTIGVAPSIQVGTVAVSFGDGSPVSNSLSPRHTYLASGIYTILATVTDVDNQTYQASTLVAVGSIPEQRETLCSVYAYLRERILAGDAAGAKKAFGNRARARYGPYFEAKGPNLADLAGKLGTIAGGLIGANSAELTTIHAQDNAWIGHVLQFSQESDGIWRIDAM